MHKISLFIAVTGLLFIYPAKVYARNTTGSHDAIASSDVTIKDYYPVVNATAINVTSVSIPSGQHVVLVCEVGTGTPDTTMVSISPKRKLSQSVWATEREVSGDGNLVVSKLVIGKVLCVDTGTYRCLAENEEMTVKDDRDFDLFVYCSPIMYRAPSINWVTNQTVVIELSVAAYPQVTNLTLDLDGSQTTYESLTDADEITKRNLAQDGLRVVRHLHFVELYLDLSRHEMTDRLTITMVNPEGYLAYNVTRPNRDHCPRDFKVTSATTDSISLSWQLINSGSLYSFFVSYTNDNVTWEDSENNFTFIGEYVTLKIRPLKPNTDYWFKIASSEDEGPVQECNQTIWGRPEIPTTFQMSNTTTSLDVSTALETSTETSTVAQTSTKSSPPVHILTTTKEVMSVSNGCQLSTSSDQCQQGWYQVEHQCILLPNRTARTHVAASDECMRLGGKLLSDPISDQVKECILPLIIGKNSTGIWINIIGRKPQPCGIMNLTSQNSTKVRCNQTMTNPRSYVCESNSSPPTITATLENIITQTSTRDNGFPTLSTKVTRRHAISYNTSETKIQDGVENTTITSTDQAHADVSTNGPVAGTTWFGSTTAGTTWFGSTTAGTTSFGSTTTGTTSFGSTPATTGAEVIGPRSAEVPRFTKQAEVGNEQTRQTEAGKVDSTNQNDVNNTTTTLTDQTQTDVGSSSSSDWTTTTDPVVTISIFKAGNVTPRPMDCPRDVKVSSMGQDSVTFMWRHQAQHDDIEFRILVFDNASNRIFAPNSPQVSDGPYTYISVTTLDQTTDYRFKMGSSLSNVTEYVCDDELPKIAYCPEDRQEEVTFVQTRGGVTREVPCPPNYEGNITRTCDDKTGSWTPFSQYNCTRRRLRIASNLAKDLSNESTEVLKDRVKNISSEVTSALEGNITIVSGDIKQIVNILEQIGQASDRSGVSNDTLQSLAAITDKLIEADTRTWDELSYANKTENAGSVLLKAMEDITSSYLHSANVTDTLIVEKNIVITVASTGQGRDNITFPKTDHATYSTNQTFNKVFLSSEALSGSVLYSVIMYTNVSDKFKVYSSSDEPSQQQRIGSDVISFSLGSNYTNLSSPLILTFMTGEFRHGAVCSYLDTKSNVSGVWLTDGCKTILKETAIDCLCSHLTNFAVLMSMTQISSQHHAILSYVSVIGISISLFCLCLTVTVYSVMWRYVKSDRSVLHINLCVCLMLGYTVFLGGISKTEHRIACAVAAALLHYLFLAVFFVMLSQGLLILKSVTSVSSVSILRYLYILMYGAPLVIVATSLGITQGEGFGTEKACWLSPQTGVLWAFVGPALSIVVVNFFILFAVIRIMQKSRIMTDKDMKRKTKSVVRTIFILSPILGVTWVLGVLSVTVDLAIFQYSFAICNSLQGLFIFIFQCVLQYQIKDGFRALLRRYRATSFDSSQRMVSTGQSQEKGYSESGQKTTSITNTSGSYKSME